MAKYYYDRYYVSRSYSNIRNPHEESRKVDKYYGKNDTDTFSITTPYRNPDVPSGHPVYDFDRGYGFKYPAYSGKNIYSSIKYYETSDAPWVHVASDHRSASVFDVIYSRPSQEGGVWYLFFKLETIHYVCDYDITYSKGSFKDTVVAESGTYPDDGESGGYWYVKGARVNTAPSTPSSIYVPSDLKEGKSFRISWGSSSDAEGNSITYKLERSINGGSYSQIYSGSSRYTHDTPRANWNTVRYRVEAYDGSLYSGYRYSSTAEVKHFPEFKMRVNGELKTSADGWVKINGELRKIDSIKVKVDGALKEV